MVKLSPMPSVSTLREEYNIARRLFLMTRNSDDLLPKHENIRCKDVDRPKMEYLPTEVANIAKHELEPFVNGRRIGNYLLGKTIGEGSFAKVKEALHICTGEKVAVKVIDKRRAQEDRYVSRNLRREAKILQLVHHPNVIQLLEVMETDRCYYIVTELCLGGDFLDFICEKKYLDEEVTKKYVRQLVSAMWSLHSAGIVHRDLKIENFLLDEDGNLKIVDFGLSNVMPPAAIETYKNTGVHAQLLSTHCGSPAYAAPELLAQKRYGPQVDVWSIGVNMYAMLTGTLPYVMEPFSIMDVYQKMMARQMNPVPENISEDCKDLLRRFLEPLPEKRITLENAARHPWLASREWHTDLHTVLYSSSLTGVDNLDENILLHIRDKIGLRMRDVINALSEGRAANASAVYRLLHIRLQRYKERDKRRNGKIEPVKFKKIEIIKKAKLLLGSVPKTEKPKFVYKGMKIGYKKSKSQPSLASDDDSDPNELNAQNVSSTRSQTPDPESNVVPYLSSRRMSNPENEIGDHLEPASKGNCEAGGLTKELATDLVRPNTTQSALRSQSDNTQDSNAHDKGHSFQDYYNTSQDDEIGRRGGNPTEKRPLSRSYSDSSDNPPLMRTVKALAKRSVQHSQLLSGSPELVSQKTSERSPVQSKVSDSGNESGNETIDGPVISEEATEQLKHLVGAFEVLTEDTKNSIEQDMEVTARRPGTLKLDSEETVVPSPVRKNRLQHGISLDEMRMRTPDVEQKREDHEKKQRRNSLESIRDKTKLEKARWERDKAPVKRKRIIRAVNPENFECLVDNGEVPKNSNSINPGSMDRIRESKSFHDFTVTDGTSHKIDDARTMEMDDLTRVRQAMQVKSAQDKGVSDNPSIEGPTTETGICGSAPFTLNFRRIGRKKGLSDEDKFKSGLTSKTEGCRPSSATPGQSLFKIDVIRVAKWRSIPICSGDLVNTQSFIPTADNTLNNETNLSTHKGKHSRRWKSGHRSKRMITAENSCKHDRESGKQDNLSCNDTYVTSKSFSLDRTEDASVSNSESPWTSSSKYEGIRSKSLNTDELVRKLIYNEDESYDVNTQDIRNYNTINNEDLNLDRDNFSKNIDTNSNQNSVDEPDTMSRRGSDGISEISQQAPNNYAHYGEDESLRGSGSSKVSLPEDASADDEAKRKFAEMKDRGCLGKAISRTSNTATMECAKSTTQNVISEVKPISHNKDTKEEFRNNDNDKNIENVNANDVIGSPRKSTALSTEKSVHDDRQDNSDEYSQCDTNVCSYTTGVEVQDIASAHSESGAMKSKMLINSDSAPTESDCKTNDDKLCNQIGKVRNPEPARIDHEQRGKIATRGNVADRFLSKIGSKGMRSTIKDKALTSRVTKVSCLGKEGRSTPVTNQKNLVDTEKIADENDNNQQIVQVEKEAGETREPSKSERGEGVGEERKAGLTESEVADDVDVFYQNEDTHGTKKQENGVHSTRKGSTERRRSREELDKLELEKQATALRAMEDKGNIQVRERPVCTVNKTRRVIVVDEPSDFDTFADNVAKSRLGKAKRPSYRTRISLESIDET